MLFYQRRSACARIFACDCADVDLVGRCCCSCKGYGSGHFAMADYSTQVTFASFVIWFQLQHQILISKMPSRVDIFPPSHGNGLLHASIAKKSSKGYRRYEVFREKKMRKLPTRMSPPSSLVHQAPFGGASGAERPQGAWPERGSPRPSACWAPRRAVVHQTHSTVEAVHLAPG